MPGPDEQKPVDLESGRALEIAAEISHSFDIETPAPGVALVRPLDCPTFRTQARSTWEDRLKKLSADGNIVLDLSNMGNPAGSLKDLLLSIGLSNPDMVFLHAHPRFIESAENLGGAASLNFADTLQDALRHFETSSEPGTLHVENFNAAIGDQLRQEAKRNAIDWDKLLEKKPKSIKPGSSYKLIMHDDVSVLVIHAGSLADRKDLREDLARGLSAAIWDSRIRGVQSIVIDLSKVSFIDDTVIGDIIALKKLCEPEGVQLSLSGVQGNVRKKLVSRNFDSYVDIQGVNPLSS